MGSNALKSLIPGYFNKVSYSLFYRKSPFLSSFSPLNVSGLIGWLKADSIIGLSDGDPVTTWLGSVGGNNATQSTTANKPTYKVNIINGLPVVRFDGIDDYMDMNIHTLIPQPCTYFMVCKSSTWQAMIIDSTAGNRNLIQSAFDPGPENHEVNLYAGTGPIAGTQPMSTTNALLISVIFNSANSKSWLNGVLDVNQDIGNLNLGGGPRIGASIVPGTFLAGDIAEVLIYDSAINDSNRISIQNHLISKYAISL